MSFFNDDEGPRPPSSSSATRGRPESGGKPSRPRPRRPSRAAGGVDRHALMVRRRIAAVVAVALIVAIVLIVSAIMQSAKTSELREYNSQLNIIARESQRKISKQFFASLVGATGKPAVNVTSQMNTVHTEAVRLAEHARELGVPSEMAEAQRSLLTALDLRSEGLAKISQQMQTALAGKTSQASTKIAGAMESLLASDVLWSQRVAPLAGEALQAAGISGQSTANSRFLPNLGWLDPETVATRITGGSASESGPLAPGTHGDALTAVSAGGVTLQAEPTLNHIPGGGSPTFTLSVQDTGENPESNVKVEVLVTSGGRQSRGSGSIGRIQPGETLNVSVPVSGVTVEVAAKVAAKVQPVRGETNTENNQATYMAFFE